MRKTFLIAVLAVGVMVAGLAGCGAKDNVSDRVTPAGISEDSNIPADKKETNTEDKTNDEPPKVEKVDISKQTAEEVMLNIYGVNVPLVSTKEEIIEIGKEAGWAFYVRQSFITVEFGDAQVIFRLKDGADASAPKEVYAIELNSKVDWDKVQIYGMDAKRYIENYEINDSFYEDINEEVRIDIFQYTFTISVKGDHTLTKVPDEEFRVETYGYDKVDYTVYGEDEYVNEVLRSILACEELMELEYFYRNEMVGKIFQQLKTFEFGDTVICGHMIDGSTVYTLRCEDKDMDYSLHLKHNFTGDTVYIRDEWEVMEDIAYAEWDAIHNKGYDITYQYDAVYNHMTTACNKLLSKGLITEYTIYLDMLTIKTARGIDYEYRLGNPSSYEITKKVFENLNTPNQEYNARMGR